MNWSLIGLQHNTFQYGKILFVVCLLASLIALHTDVNRCLGTYFVHFCSSLQMMISISISISSHYIILEPQELPIVNITSARIPYLPQLRFVDVHFSSSRATFTCADWLRAHSFGSHYGHMRILNEHKRCRALNSVRSGAALDTKIEAKILARPTPHFRIRACHNI